MDVQKEHALTSTHSTCTLTVGKIYKHYKDKLYKIIALAHDSEDPSLIRVVYQALYDCPTFGPNAIWTRTYTMFTETIVINGKQQARFQEIE